MSSRRRRSDSEEHDGEDSNESADPQLHVDNSNSNNKDNLLSSLNDEISVNEEEAKMPFVDTEQRRSEALSSLSNNSVASQPALAALLNAPSVLPALSNTTLLGIPSAAGLNLPAAAAPAALPAGNAYAALQNPYAAVGAASLPGTIPPNLLALMLAPNAPTAAPTAAPNPLAPTLPAMALLANDPFVQGLAQQQQLQTLLQQLAASNVALLGGVALNVPAPVLPQLAPVLPQLTHRSAVPLFLEYDEQTLNQYQCLLRKQIELFETTENDLKGSSQGRNTPVVFGQVGIRCRHCSTLPKSMRPKGSQYYSRTLEGVYQVCQNMFKAHFVQKCSQIPPETRAELISLQQNSKRASSGKQFWVEGLRVHGVYEDGRGLRFRQLRPGEGGF